MLKLLFLMAFTVHNIEEGLWLPGWSKNAKWFHPEVTKPEFHFALFAVTVVGYLITFASFLFGPVSLVVEGAYAGFVAVIVLNALFPHLIATIVLRKYAPGTMTALFLTAPIGGWIIFLYIKGGLPLSYMLGGAAVVGVATLLLLKPLFALGRMLVKE